MKKEKRKKSPGKPKQKPAPKKKRVLVIDGIKIHCAYSKISRIETLVPNPDNPNQHPAEQIELLAAIIKETGFRRVITVSKRSGMIVVGHARYAAAQLLGLTHVPVDEQEYPSEAAEYADLTADNRIQELSEIDEPALAKVLSRIDTGEVGMFLTGYDDNELERLLTEAGAIGEVGATPGEASDPPSGGVPPGTPPVKTPGSISIQVDPDNEGNVREWLANGEEQTKTGMGLGVLKRMGLVKD